jgi:16S rRNA (guanine966-N2)-methyltransferase
VKQTLFAVLQAGSLGPWPTPFLDLYAGSGAAGIEALSRDAPSAVFVERDGRAITTIRQNLERTGLTGRVVRDEVLRFLDRDAADEGAPFGAVVVDPPYGDAAILAALERLGDRSRGWLTADAVVVAKHFWKDMLPEQVADLAHVRGRRFGETNLAFYRAENA